MLRVGLVGCGKIADSHVAQIQRIDGCKIVGVCDREELMARQLQERYQIERVFTEVKALIDEGQADVIHITTPPQSHYPLAKQCIERGKHVFVEKPFTLTLAEAKDLIALAERHQVRLTVGHDDQFSPAARKLRAMVRKGYLGGAPVHLESHYCYELSDDYARALLSDQSHWVRQLPGGLLQNVISHGIARIAEFITDEEPEVLVKAFVSPALYRRGERELIDELRVIITDSTGLTAYFTFSSQMRPSLHQLKIYGPKNGLSLDADQQTVLRLNGKRLKSYLEKFVPPLALAKQQVANVASNLRLFGQNNFHMKEGMKYLIEAFYRSIDSGQPLPIPYAELLRTSAIMDSIFRQLKG